MASSPTWELGADKPAEPAGRVMSIDALRGLVMFTMLFVNDIALAPARVVPWWMRHQKPGTDGMTFVDLVFPAFLFIVGMSVPFAIESRVKRGDEWWRIVLHVLARTAALLLLGVLMVNGEGDYAMVWGWPAAAWEVMLFVGAILAFASFPKPLEAEKQAEHSERFIVAKTEAKRRWPWGVIARAIGFALLVFVALAYRGKSGERIVTFDPLVIRTSWWGILGLIGWAYLVASIVYLVFRGNRTALLGSMVLLLCLYAAQRTGMFKGLWLSRYVGIGDVLGSLASIAVAGLLVASIARDEALSDGARVRFGLLLALGCAAGAVLLRGLYGIDKNSATPSWCLWACAITAAVWVVFYWICDVSPLWPVMAPLAVAGENVLLAYLLHNLLYPLMALVRIDGWYARLAEGSLNAAVARAAIVAVIILGVSAVLNRVGLRIKL